MTFGFKSEEKEKPIHLKIKNLLLTVLLLLTITDHAPAQTLVRPEFIGNTTSSVGGPTANNIMTETDMSANVRRWLTTLNNGVLSYQITKDDGSSPFTWMTVTRSSYTSAKVSIPQLVQPANGYVNFNTTAGTNGYGIRDNNGTIEYKNNAGIWQSIANPAPQGGGWVDNGTTVQPLTGTDKIIAGNFNSDRNAAGFSGSDADDQITAAITDIPSTGGHIIAGLEGAQTMNADPFSGVTKQLTYQSGIGTTTISVNITIPKNVTLDLPQGSILSIDSGKTLTINGGVRGSLSSHFTGSGSVVFGANASVSEVYPQWWGALADGSNDDTAAIQSALDACKGVNNGSWWVSACSVLLPTGNYKTTAPLKMYANTAAGGYSGMKLCGVSKYATEISYSGSSSSSAIRMIGLQQKVCDLHLLNVSGWLDGIQYDGDSGVGISTGGKIQDVWIEGDSKAGNGITTGRTTFQADQLDIDHVYISGLISGRGVQTLDSNSLSINLISPTISHCWIGVQTATTSNLTIHGGELDDNDVNWIPGSGSNFTVNSVRSEGSKHSLVTASGSFPQAVSVTGYQLASDYATENSPTRQAATGTNTDSTHVTLSAASVTWGDWITIAGAGAAGALLHTHVASMTDPTHIVLDVAAISTNVVGATVLLDASVDQNNFSENGGGPYNHIGNYFNISTGALFNQANGPQNFIGNGWAENIPNPFNIALGSLSTYPAKASWTGNYYNGSPSTLMIDRTHTGQPARLYFGTVGGANNALTITGNEPLTSGLTLTLFLAPYSLQAGANTLNYNGHGADGIYKASTALFTNLGTAHAVNSLVVLIWDEAGVWRDISQ